jgi:hypothetical protein
MVEIINKTTYLLYNPFNYLIMMNEIYKAKKACLIYFFFCLACAILGIVMAILLSDKDNIIYMAGFGFIGFWCAVMMFFVYYRLNNVPYESIQIYNSACLNSWGVLFNSFFYN